MSKKKAGKTKRSDGLQPIMIDLEVHKAIEAERRNFDERPNAILRRLLGLDHQELAAVGGGPGTTGDAGNGWSFVDGDGVELVLPNGTELRAVYLGLCVSGAIMNGTWEIGRRRFRLPSRALSNDDSSKGLDGLEDWQNWEVRVPGAQEWRPLDSRPQDSAADSGRQAA